VGPPRATSLAECRGPGLSISGFYTEEIRAGSVRRGFRLVTFEGEEAVIAHVDLPPPRVSKYGVNVAAIDRFAARLRDVRDPSAIYLVDEIGKMECMSAVFVGAIKRLLESGRPLVATVAQRGGGFIDDVKRLPDAELWVVTHASRDLLPARIVTWVQAALRRS
jgi:nucleoside-triphosphatase